MPRSPSGLPNRHHRLDCSRRFLVSWPPEAPSRSIYLHHWAPPSCLVLLEAPKRALSYLSARGKLVMFFAPTSIQLLIRIGFTLVFQYIYICLGRVCISIYIRRYYSVLVSLMVIRVLFFSSDVKVSMGIELSTLLHWFGIYGHPTFYCYRGLSNFVSVIFSFHSSSLQVPFSS